MDLWRKPKQGFKNWGFETILNITVSKKGGF